MSSDSGVEYTFEQLNDKIQSLITDDFHSLEITGGEPLLNAEYIKEFLELYSYNAMLETNGTISENILLLKDVISMVSMDIKLPEHFDSYKQWESIYKSELESIKLMNDNNINFYLKIVVTENTPLDVIQKVMDDLNQINLQDMEIIIQPVSPLSNWNNIKYLFKISELIGKYFSVSIIPQIHKYMQIE